MTSIQMIPHSFVRFKTSVTFTQLRIASKAIPEIAMAIRDPERGGPTYESIMVVDATKMVDDLA